MEFSVKAIHFFGRPCVIICQNENGPCPLLAIANVLLLQGKITISSDISIISLGELTQIVANAILEKIGQSSLPEHVKLVESVLNILPKLARGLDLNVIFSGVNKFEFTEEISVFDALDIQLLHGWICDPKDTQTCAVVGDLSYNHLIFRLVEYKTLSMDRNPALTAVDGASDVPSNAEGKTATMGTPSSSEKVEPPKDVNAIRREGAVIDKFLTDTAGQFTYPGMLALYNTMQDRQCAVFFRNNHFSTVFFVNGQLFILITDLGYLHEPSVVWEILDRTDGNSEFYNDRFEPLSSAQSPGFNQRHAQEFVAAAAVGTRTLPPGSPTGGTVCSPPRAKRSEDISPAAPSTSEDTDVPDSALMSSAVLLGDHATSGNAAEQGSAEDEDGPVLATVTEPAGEGAIEDSYELVDHHLEENEGEEEVSLVPTVAPSTLDGISPLEIPAPSADDGTAIEPTVTPPLPSSECEDIARQRTRSEPELEPEPTTNTVSGRDGLAECAAPLSSIDPDLLLAMQLQEQEDLLAGSSAPDPRYNSYCDAQGFRYQAPSGNAGHSSFEPVPMVGGGEYGSVQDALMSQEERDREYSLMLHHQEIQAAETRRQSAQIGARLSARDKQDQQNRSRQQSKDKNCVIC